MPWLGKDYGRACANHLDNQAITLIREGRLKRERRDKPLRHVSERPGRLLAIRTNTYMKKGDSS